MADNKKKALRKTIREVKKRYSIQEKISKSETILKKIEQLDVFLQSKIVMVYWSMPDEVHTHDFILKWYNKKTIILPVVKDDELELRVFTGIENMSVGKAFNIGEPTGKPYTDIQSIDLILVPGVAFDHQNNRLGRGKAYYDKLLKSVNASKVGICFDFQIVDSVPVDEHDIKMDRVISD
ncbi:MAG: 5-formyltetrahydrofolate cyclo-ligase [Bacteroidetes bacterium]|nr:5-formyltetrahydrofolate cyclo-ligase [Bacteroidota bacterium]